MAIVARLRERDIALDGAQSWVAIEYELNGRLVRSEQLLRDMRNLKVRRHFKRAGIRLQLAAHQRHQAGFAAAVLTGNTYLLTAEQAEGRSRKEQPAAAPYGNVGEVE